MSGDDSDTTEPDNSQADASQPDRVPDPSDYGDPGENPEFGVGSRRRRIWIPKWLRSDPQPVRNIDQANDLHSLKARRFELSARRSYASILLVAMLAQVGIADYVFWRYMQAYDMRVPVQAISVWLGAAVVEIIGLVVVVTRYLFPPRKDDD